MLLFPVWMLPSSSHNHRMAEAGRHHWTLSSPSPLLNTGSHRAGCSGHCSTGFWKTSNVGDSSSSWSGVLCNISARFPFDISVFTCKITTLLERGCEKQTNKPTRTKKTQTKIPHASASVSEWQYLSFVKQEFCCCPWQGLLTRILRGVTWYQVVLWERKRHWKLHF